MQLNKQDIAYYRALKAIINSSKIEFKGDAVVKAASILSWFNELGERMEKAIEAKKILDPANIKMPEDKEKENGS
jgi:hypothetical protein